MDVRNSQDSNKEARMLAELIEIFFPSAQQQQQQQQQEEVVMTDVADQIAPPPPPPPPPQTMGVAVDVEEQQRRQQEELYMLTVRQSWEAQQELVYLQRKYWQYWRHLQQVNRFLSQNPQPSQLPTNTAPNNKSSEKRKLVPGANIQAVDKWAWRKYGQKPIKGSTFPRSYYKCSTSKECKAKKQVEKVQADPDVYLVTYLGDHFHPNPVQLPGPVLASLLGPIPVPVDTLNNYHPLPPPPPLPHPLTFDQLQLPPPPHQLTLSQLPLNHQLNFEQLPPLLPPNQLSFDQFQQAEIPFQLQPPPPSEMGSVAAVEAAMEEEVEDEEGLLIPNSMVNEDVMRSIQELKHWKIKGGEPGSSSGFGSSGPGSSSGFRSSGPGFY